MLDTTNPKARAMVGSAIAAAACCSAFMNFQFGFGLGSDIKESATLGAFSVALDVLKVFALPFAAVAWTKGFRIKGVVLAFMWACCACYSSLAAMGFAVQARTVTSGEREASIEAAKRAKEEYDRLIVNANAARKDKLFQQTSSCANATLPESKEFCDVYLWTEQRMQQLSPDITSAALTEADPQAAMLASYWHTDKKAVVSALALFAAFVAEVISSLGTYAFSRTIREPGTAPNKGRKRASSTP